MRELKLDVPKRGNGRTVRRLRFVAGGTQLIAWVGESGFGGDTLVLHIHTLATGATATLDDGLWGGMDPAVSPDGRFVICENHYEGAHVIFEDLTRRSEDGFYLPYSAGPAFGLGEIVFAPNGAELLAIRHLSQHGRGRFERDLARLSLEPYRNPSAHYEQKINPLTGRLARVLVYDEEQVTATWSGGTELPPGRYAHSAAISADGRFFAAGDAAGTVLVTELASGEVRATFNRTWPATVKPVERVALRVAFDPGAEWVVSLANGRLLADPLGTAKAWKTDATLAPVNDFAVHPTEPFLCVGCADGRARYIDLHTGAVTQTFKWTRKPQPLHAVCFAPDGLTCVAGGAAGKVVVWDVDQ